MADYADPQVLVSTGSVEDQLDDRGVIIVEVDVDTTAYDEGHVPGAIAWDWRTHLCDQTRREILTIDGFQNLMSESGISNQTPVILYGDSNNWFAAWAFWQMRIYGHHDVRIMNGGRKKWMEEGRPLVKDGVKPDRSVYRTTAMNQDLRAFLPQVKMAAKNRGAVLVDVRSEDEFTGEVLAPPGVTEGCQRGGHIPAARNVPWSLTYNEDGTFKSADEFRQLYEAKGITPDRQVITYCRIGERSSHSWFVLRHLLGYPDVRNYDGSWAEWGNMIGVPIETGGEQPLVVRRATAASS